MATPQHIILLLEKLFQGQPLSDQAKQSLKNWFSSNRAGDALLADRDWNKEFTEYLSFIQNTRELDQALSQFNNKAGFAGEDEIAYDTNTGGNNDNYQHVPPVRRVHFLRKWGWAAASIILLLGVGAYLWTTNKKNTEPNTVATTPVDIAPGKNGAILTLADGSQVVLDSLGNGVVARQNGAQVVLKNDRLAYDPTGQLTTKVAYNTMTTPKGRQFQVVLPDGTKVWLNAASSIHYPTVFAGKERKVDVTGEAYFEVAKDKARPFYVKINNAATVEVLGTSFNVNAYNDEEKIHTTLIEGSIAVSADRPREDRQARPGMEGDRRVILKPGQQADLTPHTLHLTTHTINTDQVLAWKSGFFNFNDVGLEEAMRQLERWYDIDVVYESAVPNIRFGGEMSRDVSLSGLLKLLSGAQLKFRIEEGRRLVVMP